MFTTLRAFWVAYILGIISLISTITNVITNTSNIKPIKGYWVKLKIIEMSNDELITTKILVKLLISRILASSFLPAVSSSGSFNSFIANFEDLMSFSFNSSIFPGVNEKKAFSAADVIVEINNITNMKNISNIINPISEATPELINCKKMYNV